MITVNELLRECQNKNITLFVQGERLGYDAPKGAMNDELRNLISRHKPELIKIFRDDSAPQKKQAVINAVTANFGYRLSHEDFTRRYLILMKAWRSGVIDDQMKDQGLDFLLDHWKGSRQ